MASGNPLIFQGVLNLTKASVTWTNFSQLNVTAPYLGKEGITLALEGQSTLQPETLTGLAQSPQPYMLVSVTMELLKTQNLSNLYKLQMESLSLLGSGTVYPDVSTGSGLAPYQLQNMAIQAVGNLLLNGTTPIFGVTCRGYYVVNNLMFS